MQAWGFEYKTMISKNGRIIQSENSVHYQVCQYLKIQFPHVFFHTDASGELRTEAQRFRHAKLNKGFQWPDLFIAHPIGTRCGLFLELKKDRSALYKADGVTWKNEHVMAQNGVLQHLRGLSYSAYFACGFEEAKELIDSYLSGQ